VPELLRGNDPPDLAQIISDRQRAVQQRERILAHHEQRLIDAEVRATRRALLKASRLDGNPHAATFLDEDSPSPRIGRPSPGRFGCHGHLERSAP
jgi:hypothetical protein